MVEDLRRVVTAKQAEYDTLREAHDRLTQELDGIKERTRVDLDARAKKLTTLETQARQAAEESEAAKRETEHLKSVLADYQEKLAVKEAEVC